MAKRPSKAAKPVTTEPPPAPAAPPPPPLTLEQIIGQDRAIATLRASVESGRIHHAWIFHGPAGVGKFSTAVAFAALLLDPTTGPDLSGRIAPDPESHTQGLIRAWAHPDLHIVTKELAAVSRDERVRPSKQTTIAKEVLEEFLIEPATRTRTSPGRSLAGKVFVVDEAELMAAAGQNSLLKTLEEPAPGRVIILVTSAEERLLPTIRSRCQRVAFTPLPEPEMRRWFGGAGLELADEEREWLLAYAAGSPGTLLSAVESKLYGWQETVGPMLGELDQGKFPINAGAAMASLVDEWAAEWVKRRPNASKDMANRVGARRMFRLLGLHYRMRLRAAGGPGRLRAIELIAEAERQLDANVQLSFVMENLTAQLAAAGGR